MGILGLAKLIYEKAPGAVRENEMKNYFGRRIAIDASMSIYQFIIAMKGFDNGEGQELANANGDVTSHLNGLWSRTLRMIDEGLKPIYVFDGAPPELKKAELDERKKKAAEAEAAFEKAKEEGDDDAMERLSKRTVRVSRAQIEECKTLLRLMGVPVVQAASEAEAQCCELVKGGKAWAVGTEDMDALTFGAPILLRHLTFSEAKKRPVAEFRIDDVLQQMGFTMDTFIDLCILLGCDYTGKITGIGPQKAFDGLKQHGSIEALVASLDPQRYPVVAENFDFTGARGLFKVPPVVPCDQVDIAWTAPDADGLRRFLVEEKLFNPARVEAGILRLTKALSRKTQGRLDDFFKPIPRAVLPTATAAAAASPSSPAASGATRKLAAVGQKRSASAAEEGGPAAQARRVGVNGAKKAVKK